MNDTKYKAKGTINLKSFATSEIDLKAKKKLKGLRKEIAKLQDIMYAENKYSLLICLQGMDTSGKDSLVREVFKNVNANGVNVNSFKVPTPKELSHDYLWRHYLVLPKKGNISIFNRTHYENVLVTRVHPEYILGENIPGINNIEDITPNFYHNRMQQINNFEKHIAENGTIILKFYLHLSKDEQKKRLIRRIDTPEKNWKFSASDLKERKLWLQYMKSYEDLLSKTSTEIAPWYIIPSDDKKFSRLLIAQVIEKTLRQFKFQYPILSHEDKKNLKIYRDVLKND